MKITKATLIALIDASSLNEDDLVTSITITDKHVKIMGYTFDETGGMYEVQDYQPIKVEDDTINLK